MMPPKNLNIAIVAEGPIDVDLLSQLISELVPGNHNFDTIQPVGSSTKGFGSFGGGWHGVRDWCKDIANKGGISNLISASNYDLFIIHIDGDIATDPEVNMPLPCPPIIPYHNPLDEVLSEWLQVNTEPDKVLYFTPSENIETWIVCALDINLDEHNPPEKFLERFPHPEKLLCVNKRSPLKRKSDGSGSCRKDQTKYNAILIPLVLQEWDKVKSFCIYASYFQSKLFSKI